MINTIITALTSKLEELFPGIDVYKGDTQTLNKPCFIINVQKSNQSSGILRKKQKITLNLIYLEESTATDKESKYNNAIDTLYKGLEIIEADGEIFRINNLSHIKSDESLQFMCIVSLIFVENQINDNLMNVIEISSEVKEND